MKINDILFEDQNKIDAVVKEIKQSKYYENVLKPELLNYKNARSESIANGDVDPEHIINTITTLFHGTKKRYYLDKVTFTPREQPKDTMPLIHNYVNELAKERFGVPVRNGLFVSPSRLHASAYGEVHMFIPVGDYKFYFEWEVDDFTAVYAAASNADFNAWFVDTIIDGTLESIVSEEEHRLFNGVYEHDYDDIKSFEQLYRYTLGNFFQAIERKFPDERKNELKKKVKTSLIKQIDDSKKRFQTYVKKLRETDHLKGVKNEEIIVWFDTAYIVDIHRNNARDIIYKLITSLE